MKKFEEEHNGNHERWLITYSDLITLLLIFFIILYSFSKIDQQKYTALTNALGSVMGTGTGKLIGEGGGGDGVIPLPVPGNNDDSSSAEVNSGENTNSTEKDKLEELKGQVDKYLNENGLNSNVNTMIEDRGLIIRVDNTIIFDSGKADIKDIYKSKLIQVGKMLNSIENYIRIEGHTDNVPIKNSHFESNWQLSVIRATNVTEMLINEANINPKRLSAVGYGEYRPISDNTTTDGRSKNRRVDIVIMDTKFNKIEGN
ncbi:chemotaxis protein MotB [Clostridium punense]|uniref:Chemotaxis protein MotB n=1 Tax=Clostridium punense TaxID=1054297 RepID=A0ABS4K4S6_9CLOT|nr:MULTISPECIES: flagellar motor protein MotB [Clostridium]EQB89399.1 hypothetical protein M918_20365 [Clostridium sp. BL8]MBP2022787.1 chemotaxis protein MotB [Clostridium punense]